MGLQVKKLGATEQGLWDLVKDGQKPSLFSLEDALGVSEQKMFAALRSLKEQGLIGFDDPMGNSNNPKVWGVEQPSEAEQELDKRWDALHKKLAKAKTEPARAKIRQQIKELEG
jgi:hypothetical protein